jgi:hypothetical protein
MRKTKKQELLDYLRDPDSKMEYLVMFIHLPDYPKVEMIINQRKNWKQKADYIEQKYDDDLNMIYVEDLYIKSTLFVEDKISIRQLKGIEEAFHESN